MRILFIFILFGKYGCCRTFRCIWCCQAMSESYLHKYKYIFAYVTQGKLWWNFNFNRQLGVFFLIYSKNIFFDLEKAFHDFAHAGLSNHYKIWRSNIMSIVYRIKTDNWLNHHLSAFPHEMAKKIIIAEGESSQKTTIYLFFLLLCSFLFILF